MACAKTKKPAGKEHSAFPLTVNHGMQQTAFDYISWLQLNSIPGNGWRKHHISKHLSSNSPRSMKKMKNKEEKSCRQPAMLSQCLLTLSKSSVRIMLLIFAQSREYNNYNFSNGKGCTITHTTTMPRPVSVTQSLCFSSTRIKQKEEELQTYSDARICSNSTLTMSSPLFTLRRLREWLPAFLTVSCSISWSSKDFRVPTDFDAFERSSTCCQRG